MHTSLLQVKQQTMCKIPVWIIFAHTLVTACKILLRNCCRQQLPVRSRTRPLVVSVTFSWLTEYLFPEVTVINCISPLQLLQACDGEWEERTTYNSGWFGSRLPRKLGWATKCLLKSTVNNIVDFLLWSVLLSKYIFCDSCGVWFGPLALGGQNM